MSNLTFKANFTDRAGAMRFLAGRTERKVAHNTIVRLNDDGDPAVRYHNTDIVTHHADGSVTLDCGGWPTPTTCNRLIHFTKWIINGRYPRKDWSAEHRLEVRYGHGQDPIAVLTSSHPAATLTY